MKDDLQMDKNKIHDIIGKLHSKPVLIDAIINSTCIPALVDLGCTIYSVLSDSIATRLNLPRQKVPPRELKLAKDSDKDMKLIEDEICWADVDLDGKCSTICGYVIPGLAHDIILGEPWMRYNDVIYRARDRVLFLERENHIICTHSSASHIVQVEIIRHTAMSAFLRRAEKQQRLEEDKKTISVYAASVNDINKMLEPKRQFSREEIKARLPEKLRHHLSIFKADKNDETDLLPIQKGVDLAIEIEKDEQGRTKNLPQGVTARD